MLARQPLTRLPGDHPDLLLAGDCALVKPDGVLQALPLLDGRGRAARRGGGCGGRACGSVVLRFLRLETTMDRRR